MIVLQDVLLVLEACLRLRSTHKNREITLEQFLTDGAGTGLRTREFIERVRVPRPSTARWVQVRVVIEGLESYGAYAALRRTLVEDAGARSALPVEMERGRVVLRVVADREENALLEALLAAAPPDLRIIPLSADNGTLRLRVRQAAPPPAADVSAGRPGAGAGAIDTPRRNRY